MGQPYRTQELVRRALLRLFYDPSGKRGGGKKAAAERKRPKPPLLSPGSFPGNDDLGQMSSWYVFAALGLYPAIPGTDVLVLGSPLFRRATLRLPGGAVEIEAPAAARKRPYVRALTLDGGALDQPWLPFSELADGGRLTFTLGSQPDPAWAGGAGPPS